MVDERGLFLRFGWARKFFITACGILFVGCPPVELVKNVLPEGRSAPRSKARVITTQEVVLESKLTAYTPSIKLTASGLSIVLNRSNVDSGSKGSIVWVGKIRDEKYSLATIAFKKDSIISGSILSGKGILTEILNVRPGVHVIRTLDANTFPQEGEPIVPATPSFQPDAGSSCSEEDPDTVRVAVHYTAAVRDSLGGEAQAEAIIAQAVAASNLTYLNSGISARLKLSHSSLVDYVEGTYEEDLKALRDPSDGKMDEVFKLRDDYYSDVVVLFSNTQGACGVAFRMDPISSLFAPSAFAVVDPSCAVGNLTFPHEVGHNMGADHDIFVQKMPGTYPYARGWVDTVAWQRSVMAYEDRCKEAGKKCPRQARWSNPDIGFGVAVGLPNAADNRLMLNNSVATVANFRCTPRTMVGSTFISTSITPGELGAFWYLDGGREQPLTIEMKNTGTRDWVDGFALALVNPGDNKNLNGARLLVDTKVRLRWDERIRPGDSKVFSFSFIGEGRSLHFQWQMQDERGVPFGEKTPDIQLQPKGG